MGKTVLDTITEERQWFQDMIDGLNGIHNELAKSGIDQDAYK